MPWAVYKVGADQRHAWSPDEVVAIHEKEPEAQMASADYAMKTGKSHGWAWVSDEETVSLTKALDEREKEAKP